MLILPGNSITMIPPGVCDIYLWIFLSKQGSSLNSQTYPFRINGKEKNAKGDNRVMKNNGLRRLSEEIKKNSKKLKLTRTKAGTYLRNLWEELWNFLESMMDDLMFNVSLNIRMLWKFWTVIKKREDNTLMSLYIRDWKRGGFILLKSWMEIRSVGSKSLRWMPETQCHPKYLMTLREFRSVRSNGKKTKITSLYA